MSALERARDALAATIRDWLDSLATAARVAIAEGHLRRDADPEQLAFGAYGVMLALHTMTRLVEDPEATARARRALDALIDAAR